MTRRQYILLVIIGAVSFLATYSLLNRSSNDSFTKSQLSSIVTGEMRKLTFYETPKPLPDHTIIMPDGSTAPLSSLKGKVLFINLWAFWCAPCRAEMHDVAKLQDLLGGDQFHVVAINQDEGGLKRADRTLRQWGVEGLTLYGDKEMLTATKMAEGKLPTSFIVDKNGMMLAEFAGPLKWDGEDALKLFKALIDQ